MTNGVGDNFGGGVARPVAGSFIELSQCEVSNNKGSLTGGGNGGAIAMLNHGILRITDCTFRDNQAGQGGAIYIDFNQGGVAFEHIVEIDRSSFIGNQTGCCGNGAAINYARSSQPGGGFFANSTFSGSEGSSIVVAPNGLNPGDFKIINVTAVDNIVSSGATIQFNQHAYMANTVIARTTRNGIPKADCRYKETGTFIANHIQDPSLGSLKRCIAQTTGDPDLGALDGIPGDHYGASAILINAGNNAEAAGFALDQRGNARIVNGTVDIGAVEGAGAGLFDTDEDGVPDSQDAFPNDPDESADTDEDGVGDNADAFPNDPTESADADGDGIGDNADPDDDNDGILDVDESVSSSSILTFEPGTPSGPIPDPVNSPNITVDFLHSNYWSTRYGDLLHVRYTTNGVTPSMEITFTADSGFLAVLKSFDMGGWPDSDYDITSVQVWDGSGVVLYDSGPVTIEGAFDGGPRHTHFEFSPELEAEVLRIRIDCLALGGACWNNGIDNVAYGQKQAGASGPADSDGDGVADNADLCPGTALGTAVGEDGCPLDTTPPDITPNVNGTLGNNGWYVSDVAVTWTVTDGESDVTTAGCGAQNVTADTAGVTFTCSAESEGGSASESVTIKRDATAPTITASRDVGPNANGWNNTPVTVSYTCTDGLSGIDTCSSPETLGEGGGQSATGTAVDLTNPVITASRDVGPNANGWNNSSVTVSYFASNVSTIIFQGGEVTGSPTSGYSESGLTMTMTDSFNPHFHNGVLDTLDPDGAIMIHCCGNGSENALFDMGGATFDVISFEISPTTVSLGINVFTPSSGAPITVTTPGTVSPGWTDITSFTWNISGSAAQAVIDNLVVSGSGIDAGASDLGDDVLSSEGAGQSGTGTAVDLAGNSASATESPINIDSTAPVAVHSGPFSVAEGSSVLLDGTGSTDNLSGVATTAWDTDGDGYDDGDPATFNGIDDGVIGVSLQVIDLAGNVSVANTSVTVNNVAPVITSASGDSILEGGTASVSAGYTDVGTLDTHEATIDWGDSTSDGPSAVSGGSVSGSHAYGDNGTYTVTITVEDDDTGTVSTTVAVNVANVAPTLSFDTSGAVSFAGGPAFLGRVNREQTHDASATDPGSDDLTFTWGFAPDPTAAANTYFNNGASADPLPSTQSTRFW